MCRGETHQSCFGGLVWGGLFQQHYPHLHSRHSCDVRTKYLSANFSAICVDETHQLVSFCSVACCERERLHTRRWRLNRGHAWAGRQDAGGPVRGDRGRQRQVFPFRSHDGGYVRRVPHAATTPRPSSWEPGLTPARGAARRPCRARSSPRTADRGPGAAVESKGCY